ncbi:hypothetical protein [Silvanigrella aquatica]|uniref:Autotransporter domain-containing protein n=1 Tax=Silvanigrella aquatica TaxID=1915309 RepID=A0A1L4D173_9BACT|nr:hypothetical protein [Silvanigrella aquatica]APJ03949.1 hypothetical protein AXG55_08535 [Silvanigrella aquatica]
MNIYILFIIGIICSFFCGVFYESKKSYHDIQFQKELNHNHIKNEIQKELNNLNAKKNQIVIKKTLKKPDGTVKIEESVYMQNLLSIKNAKEKNFKNIDNIHFIENMRMQKNNEFLNMDLYLKYIYSFANFSTQQNFQTNISIGGKVSFKMTNSFWIFTSYEHHLASRNNLAEIGAFYRLSF